MKNLLNYLLILTGGVVAIYAQATEEQNTVVLILGMVILMFGIYRIASQIPSKSEKQQDNEEDNHEV
ncbi:hypothetical protein [Hanstruepera ponticola]|uniref:hypothetical protein n=1 Tax=Hanstruepera ponticola TaxID=2042995 RepID=UPI000CF1B315|nr:hypothetical protein [Hanstruepera ponticola]